MQRSLNGNREVFTASPCDVIVEEMLGEVFSDGPCDDASVEGLFGEVFLRGPCQDVISESARSSRPGRVKRGCQYSASGLDMQTSKLHSIISRLS
jgi:hypothetical protein